MIILAQKLGFKSLDDFYGISPDDIRNNGGKGLLDHVFEGSISDALQSVYPGHNWMVWRFGRVPTNFWEDEKNQISFMDWLGVKLGFNKMEDWYKITTDRYFEEWWFRIARTNSRDLLHYW